MVFGMASIDDVSKLFGRRQTHEVDGKQEMDTNV